MALTPFAESSLLELLFESNHTPIAFMDLDFNFIHVNQAYALADDKDVSFFPGKNHFEHYPNEDNQKIFNEVVETGRTHVAQAKVFEYVDMPERKTTFWDWSLRVVKDNLGQDIGVLLQLINVTKQVTTEQKLYEKIKKELHHYDEELETIIVARTKLLQEAVSSLQYENKERIKTEALMLKAKEDAEKANISKSQFLSRMSHELRTPMNAILGFSQLLNISDLNEKQESFNGEILLAGNHLQSMISDILDLSRIEEGQLSVSTTDIPLVRLITESISLVKHKLDFRNVTIHNLIPETDSIVLNVDETRIKEVLVNLLTNAVKYNTDNGLVSIGYKALNKTHIRIFISDTGKGLTQQEQKEIFEPFNRLGAEYTDIEGVGIGLAISKKLIELMNGSISIESEPGKGSTFYLDCPIGNKIARPTDKKIESHLKDTTLHYDILYVEDNTSNQRVVELLLQDYSYFNLTIAATAEEGLNEIAKHSFDLIILDIELPGLDGYNVLENLINNPETENIPVIALTASASSDDIKKGLDAGFSQYITKPVALPELISTINSELNRTTQ